MGKVCKKCQVELPDDMFISEKGYKLSRCSTCRELYSTRRAEYMRNRRRYNVAGVNDTARRQKQRYRSRAMELYHMHMQDNNFRISRRIRSRIQKWLVTGSHRHYKGLTPVQDIVGMPVEEYRVYIQDMFEPGMSWNNYGCGVGQWCIDHIIAVCHFDLTDHEQVKQCFHYSNTQPMWSLNNRRKHIGVEVPA